MSSIYDFFLTISLRYIQLSRTANKADILIVKLFPKSANLRSTEQARMIKKLKIIFYIGLYFPLIAYAQFTDSTAYQIRYTSTGAFNKTNDGQSWLLNNAAKIGVRKKSYSLNWNNTWIYGKQDSKLTNNDYSSALDFNLYKGFPRTFFWGLVNYNTSKSLKINNQLLAGAGIAYSFIDSDNAYLNLSDGILFDSSDLILDDIDREIYHTWRNSLRLTGKYIYRNLIELNSSSFFQPSLNDKDDYTFKSVSSVAFKLNKWLSLTTAFQYNRISRTDRENLLFSYGLTFERYF